MIFYEKERAEELLENGFFCFIKFEELIILAKYFRDEKNKNDREIKESLISFCKEYDEDFNEILSRKKIADAVRISKKYKIKKDTDICITKKEIESINTFEEYKIRKVLFVMAVISKYLKYNHDGDNKNVEDKSYYVSSCSFINILKMAKVNVSKNERKRILYKIDQSGLITTLPTGCFKVNFIDENSEKFVTIKSLNNIIDYYPKICANCGAIIENNPKNHNLCPNCYKEKRREDVKNNVRRYRVKDK